MFHSDNARGEGSLTVANQKSMARVRPQMIAFSSNSSQKTETPGGQHVEIRIMAELISSDILKSKGNVQIIPTCIKQTFITQISVNTTN
jgi:hypothetical protein